MTVPKLHLAPRRQFVWERAYLAAQAAQAAAHAERRKRRLSFVLYLLVLTFAGVVLGLTYTRCIHPAPRPLAGAQYGVTPTPAEPVR